MPRRDVEGDAHVRALSHRVGHVLAHATHQLAGKLQHQPARLQKQDEGVRLDKAAVRLAPAHQHFGADQPSALQVDDRLVVRQELVVADRPRHVRHRIDRTALEQEQRDQQDDQRDAAGHHEADAAEIVMIGNRTSAWHRNRDDQRILLRRQRVAGSARPGGRVRRSRPNPPPASRRPSSCAPDPADRPASKSCGSSRVAGTSAASLGLPRLEAFGGLDLRMRKKRSLRSASRITSRTMSDPATAIEVSTS